MYKKDQTKEKGRKKMRAMELGRKHTKTDIYRAERENGLTYRQIAEKYGVSIQCVAQACGKSNPRYFKTIKDNCIYPNLRNWMNDNKVSRKTLAIRMGLVGFPATQDNIGNYMTGKTDPPKRVIDKLIEITGMTYEELFYTEVEKC